MKKQFWALILGGFVALSFLACAKKDENNAVPTPVCPNGYYSSGGTCIPGNGGLGGNNGGTYTPFRKNGDITDGSRFRDLVHRTVGYYYHCSYNAQYSCRDLQVSLRKINDTQYTVTVRSAAYPGSYGTYIAGYNYSGSAVYSQTIPGGFAIEVMNYNPYPYIIFEVVIYGSLDQSQVQYEINFERRPIASGIMTKGRDY